MAAAGSLTSLRAHQIMRGSSWANTKASDTDFTSPNRAAARACRRFGLSEGGSVVSSYHSAQSTISHEADRMHTAHPDRDRGPHSSPEPSDCND